MAGCGRLCPVVSGCVRLWPVVAGCGLLWPVVAGCGRLWPVVAGCGRLWPVVAGCGWLWLVLHIEFTAILSRGLYLEHILTVNDVSTPCADQCILWALDIYTTHSHAVNKNWMTVG